MSNPIGEQQLKAAKVNLYQLLLRKPWSTMTDTEIDLGRALACDDQVQEVLECGRRMEWTISDRRLVPYFPPLTGVTQVILSPAFEAKVNKADE